MKNISVCLLSGGIDSCVAATLRKQAGDEIYFLSIDQGQVQVRELENAKKIAEILKPVDHRFIKIINFDQISQSSLSGHKEIPSASTLEENMKRIPDTYPRGRDPCNVDLAVGWLETLIINQVYDGAKVRSGKVVIGTNKEDSLVYPDCKPSFYVRRNGEFRENKQVPIEFGIPMEMSTPLLKLTKKDVIKLGHDIGAPLEYTRSCYRDGEIQCGECDPCRIIYFAFKDLGIKNPFTYQNVPEKRYS